MSVLVARFSNGQVVKISNSRAAPKFCGLIEYEHYGCVEQQKWHSSSRAVVLSRINECAAFLLKKFKRDVEIKHYEIVDLVPATAEETMAYRAEMKELNEKFRRKPIPRKTAKIVAFPSKARTA